MEASNVWVEETIAARPLRRAGRRIGWVLRRLAIRVMNGVESPYVVSDQSTDLDKEERRISIPLEDPLRSRRIQGKHPKSARPTLPKS